eukprot:scaffold191219_cov37-Tisochrysis_lutea.AAC.3
MKGIGSAVGGQILIHERKESCPIFAHGGIGIRAHAYKCSRELSLKRYADSLLSVAVTAARD